MMASKDQDSVELTAIGREERILHEILFYSQGPVNGFLTGERARDLFLHSKLSLKKLSQIWNLADVSNDNLLSVDEFVLAMHFILEMLQGKNVPKDLPPSFYKLLPPPVDLPLISDREKEAYTKVFQMYDDHNNGSIPGGNAMNLLKVSQLSSEQLQSVWSLSDINRDGTLDMEEWGCACHLVRLQKQGYSLEGSIDMFNYMPDRISPTSLRASKQRVEDYEKKKQKLMCLKEKRKNEGATEKRRLEILRDKLTIQQKLFRILKKLGKFSPEREEEFHKRQEQEKENISIIEAVVYRLKKDHEKIRQETVKVILEEQKLQGDIVALKRESDELRKRSKSSHSKATKDPDPFHQLYEQRKEQRKRSTLSEGEEPEVFLPFDFNPFDPEASAKKRQSADIIVNDSETSGNNITTTGDKYGIILKDLCEFNDKFIELWSSSKWRTMNSTMEAGSNAELDDPTFKNIKDNVEDFWFGLTWSDLSLIGNHDNNLRELNQKLIDLRNELHQLNSDCGQMIFRNPEDYIAAQKAKEKELLPRSPYQRRSRPGSQIDRTTHEAGLAARDYRQKRRSLNLNRQSDSTENPPRRPDRYHKTYFPETKSQYPNIPERPRRKRNSASDEPKSPTSPSKPASLKKTRAPDAPNNISQTVNTENVSFDIHTSLEDSLLRQETDSTDQSVPPQEIGETVTPSPTGEVDLQGLDFSRKSKPESKSLGVSSEQFHGEFLSDEKEKVTHVQSQSHVAEAPTSSSSLSVTEKPSDLQISPTNDSKSEENLLAVNFGTSVSPNRPPRRRQKDSPIKDVHVEHELEDHEKSLKSVEKFEENYVGQVLTESDEVVTVEKTISEPLIVDVKKTNISVNSEDNTNLNGKQIDDTINLELKTNLKRIEYDGCVNSEPKTEDFLFESVAPKEISLGEFEFVPLLENLTDITILPDNAAVNVENINNIQFQSQVEVENDKQIEREIEPPTVITELPQKQNLQPETFVEVNPDFEQCSQNVHLESAINVDNNDIPEEEADAEIAKFESTLGTIPLGASHILLNSDSDIESNTPPPLPNSAPPPSLNLNTQLLEEEIIEISTSNNFKMSEVDEILDGREDIKNSTKQLKHEKFFHHDVKLIGDKSHVDSDDSDVEDGIPFEAEFIPGETVTKELPTSQQDDDIDDGSIQLMSYSVTMATVQSPGESQDSAFEDLMSSMTSMDADISTPLTNSMDEQQLNDSLLSEKKTREKVDMPEVKKQLQIEEMVEIKAVKVEARKEPCVDVAQHDFSISSPPRDTTNIVKRAKQFADIVQAPPKFHIKRDKDISDDMSSEKMEEMELKRRAVISESTVRRRGVADSVKSYPFDETSDDETTEDFEATNTFEERTTVTVYNVPDNEEGDTENIVPDASFGKADCVAIYSKNIVQEKETTEAVDRESIANLSSTRNQWEQFLKQSTKHEESVLVKPLKPTVRHWEVSSKFKPLLVEQTANLQAEPIVQTEIIQSVSTDETDNMDPYLNESAIEREIRLAMERENMLKQEQMERHELQARQKGVSINSSSVSNTNQGDDFRPTYYEMTEADRGSEMSQREAAIQQELEEIKLREQSLHRPKDQNNVNKQNEASKVDPDESIIEREIRLQYAREQEISQRYKTEIPTVVVEKSPSVQSDSSEPEGTQTDGHKIVHKDRQDIVISPLHNRGESIIARELRELKEKEDELQKQRQVAHGSFQTGYSQKPIEEKRKSQETRSRPISWSPNVSFSTQFGNESCKSPATSEKTPSRVVHVHPHSDDPQTPEHASTPSVRKETPIEQEIRLATERENELRKQKGLPLINTYVKKDDAETELPSTPISSQSGSNFSHSMRHGVDYDSGTMRRFASSRLENELMIHKKRENALRNEGIIITTSEEHIGPLKYTEVIGENRDEKPAKRNFTTKKMASNSQILEQKLQENGELEIKNPDSEQSKFPKQRFHSVGATFTFKESRQKAESKIEQELREMREREEELRQQRGISPVSPQSPKETNNNVVDRKAQWEQSY